MHASKGAWVKNDKKVIAAWAMYDWANSPFTTLVVTFVISGVFIQAFAPDEITGTRLWTRAVSISALIVALCSPLLGAMADRGGFRRKFLMISTAVCVLATVGIALISPSRDNAILLMLTVFVVANVAFEVGMVFYNAFLPDIVTKEKIGRVSGYGWALGYGGGLVALLVGWLAFVGSGDGDGWLGLSTAGAFNARATAFLAAGWLAVFSIPTFLFVRDPDRVPGAAVSVRGAFADLAKAFRNIRKYREIVKFLVARLVFNDGLVTIFGISSIYAIGTFGFTLREVMVMGIVINVAAGAGAFAFGFIDDKIGGKATVQVSLVALALAALLAALAPSKAWFWVAAIIIGVFAGPNQSASRSLMGRFVPDKHESEFFGFFAFSGKATAFFGPLLFGMMTTAFNNQRAGAATIFVFFVVGGLILSTVNEQRGIEAAAGA